MAIKILEKSKITEQADLERIKREIKILKLMRHPHIIQLFEVIFFLKKKKQKNFKNFFPKKKDSGNKQPNLPDNGVRFERRII